MTKVLFCIAAASELVELGNGVICAVSARQISLYGLYSLLDALNAFLFYWFGLQLLAQIHVPSKHWWLIQFCSGLAAQRLGSPAGWVVTELSGRAYQHTYGKFDFSTAQPDPVQPLSDGLVTPSTATNG